MHLCHQFLLFWASKFASSSGMICALSISSHYLKMAYCISGSFGTVHRAEWNGSVSHFFYLLNIDVV
jgi:hypothetical protein